MASPGTLIHASRMMRSPSRRGCPPSSACLLLQQSVFSMEPSLPVLPLDEVDEDADQASVTGIALHLPEVPDPNILSGRDALTIEGVAEQLERALKLCGRPHTRLTPVDQRPRLRGGLGLEPQLAERVDQHAPRRRRCTPPHRRPSGRARRPGRSVRPRTRSAPGGPGIDSSPAGPFATAPSPIHHHPGSSSRAATAAPDPWNGTAPTVRSPRGPDDGALVPYLALEFVRVRFLQHKPGSPPHRITRLFNLT